LQSPLGLSDDAWNVVNLNEGISVIEFAFALMGAWFVVSVTCGFLYCAYTSARNRFYEHRLLRCAVHSASREPERDEPRIVNLPRLRQHKDSLFVIETLCQWSTMRSRARRKKTIRRKRKGG
jgi:hypothetical protein